MWINVSSSNSADATEHIDKLLTAKSKKILELSKRQLDNTAWYDFSYYEYFMNPDYRHNPRSLISPHGSKYLNYVKEKSGASHDYYEESKFMFDLEERILTSIDPHGIDSQISIEIKNLYMEILFTKFAKSSSLYYKLWNEYKNSEYFLGELIFNYNVYDILSDYDTLENIPESAPHNQQYLYSIIYSDWHSIKDHITDKHTQLDKPSNNFKPDFNVLKPMSYNIGLRYVYRQEWRPLGIQRGETVRSISLGPKQTEKISKKIIRRTKINKTSESLKTIETNKESSDTTKDSSEIVKEASSNFGWNVEAEASGSIGVAKGSVSAGAHGEYSKKSNSTSSDISEKIQKTSSKVRAETKVIISTESENTFEQSSISEIQNPNDEVPITYYYNKIQRQYEIFTSINEVSGVIFVAEPLPRKINVEWVRKYDWIISKVLLDDSFMDILISITQNSAPKKLDQGVYNNLDTYLEKTIEKKPGTISVSNADLSQGEKFYLDAQKEILQKEMERELFDQKQQRLLQHIEDNILHYCRSIWMAEDPEQRFLRYSKYNIRIPTVWEFLIDSEDLEIGSGESDFDNIVENGMLVSGKFVPVTNEEHTITPITKLIDITGPIGFAGNYAVYKIKPDHEIDNKYNNDIFDMLHLARSPYVNPDSPTELLDPHLKFVENHIKIPNTLKRETKEDMIDYVPDLRSTYELLPEGEKTQFIGDDNNFKHHYHEYYYRKEQTRKILVDTNDVILDIEVGDGTIMEDFKKLHRYYDVLKAKNDHDKTIDKKILIDGGKPVRTNINDDL